MENLQPVFDRYAQIYNDIFKDFYPSVKSTGFTERNQTVNWSKAYEDTYPNDDVLTWFEFPFSEKEYEKHLDAIVLNRKKGVLYLLESKRFSDTTRKVSSISNDIHRIIELSGSIREDSRFSNNLEIKNIYGIILADLWTENAKKKLLLDSFKHKYFALKYLKTRLDESDLSVLKKALSFDSPIEVKDSSQTYNLLMLVIPLITDY